MTVEYDFIPSNSLRISDAREDIIQRIISRKHSLGKLEKTAEKSSIRFEDEIDEGSVRLQQALIDGVLEAKFMDAAGECSVSTAAWRSNEGRSALVSAKIGDKTIENRGTIYINIANYLDFIKKSYLDAFQGNWWVVEKIEAFSQSHAVDVSRAGLSTDGNDRRPISEADIRKAIDLLRAKSATETMTKPQRLEFLCQAFPGRHIGDRVFRRIQREVPSKIGRPKKDGREV